MLRIVSLLILLFLAPLLGSAQIRTYFQTCEQQLLSTQLTVSAYRDTVTTLRGSLEKLTLDVRIASRLIQLKDARLQTLSDSSTTLLLQSKAENERLTKDNYRLRTDFNQVRDQRDMARVFKWVFIVISVGISATALSM